VKSDDPGLGASGGRATGGHVVSGTGGRGGTGGSDLDTDAGLLVANDAAKCAQLNIGILGNPGSNGSSNFQAWLQMRGTTVARIQTTPDVPLTADALKPFDVVVLDFLPRDYTADEAAIFGAWVSAGGGVVAMSGYQDNTSEDWRANSLMMPLGLSFAGDRFGGPVMQFATHPITQGLTSVTFIGGYGVSFVAGGTTTATAVAFVSHNGDQAPVAYAAQIGNGKALLFGDEWIEFDSEWSSQPQIPRFWLQIFSWIAPGDRCMLTGIG